MTNKYVSRTSVGDGVGSLVGEGVGTLVGARVGFYSIKHTKKKYSFMLHQNKR